MEAPQIAWSRAAFDFTAMVLRRPCALAVAISSWPPVNPKRTSDDSPETTLGDLLYADRSGTIPEQDWVRLVEAIAQSDQQALRALYERTNCIVFTLVIRICGTRETAEEVTLDVFHDVWRRAAEYDPKDGTVLGWVMMQARSRSLDRLRFEQRKKRVAPDQNELPEGDSSGPQDAIAIRQYRDMLQAAFATLSADERQTIETAFFSELTYPETAARLHQPIGTVKTRVRSGLAKLREAMRIKGAIK
jgi:RNA polymerase sigma-70 factor, ECF subfamily